MKRVIPITIRDKIATAPRDALYVCGNSDYTINFTFDEEWEGFNEKTARFVFNGQYLDMIFSGDVCPVPIISNTYAFEVGVYAGKLRTTTKAYVPATKSVLCGGDVPAEPVSVYVPASELEKKADKKYVQQYVEDRVQEVSGSNVYTQLTEPTAAPDGSVWIVPEVGQGTVAEKLYLQPEEPVNAPDGSVWIVPGGNQGSGVSRAEMEQYVTKAISEAFDGIAVAEEGAY